MSDIPRAALAALRDAAAEEAARLDAEMRSHAAAHEQYMREQEQAIRQRAAEFAAEMRGLDEARQRQLGAAAGFDAALGAGEGQAAPAETPAETAARVAALEALREPDEEEGATDGD